MIRSEAPGRLARRILTHGLENEPLWVCLYVRDLGGTWAAILVAGGKRPPEPGTMKGVAFFADTAEEAERLARRHLGEGGAQN